MFDEYERKGGESVYIDIHNHCLPGIDDGSSGLEESLSMLRISAENGVHQIIATPHCHYRRGHAPAETIREKVELLNKSAAEQNIDIELYSGNEIYYSHDVPELLESGQILTLADSEYALIEFSPSAEYDKVRRGLYNVMTAGFAPILAHAERVEALVEDISLVDELIEMGSYIQMNITSVRTNSSRNVRKFVKTAIKNDMVHFFATDAHRSIGRTPDMQEDLRYLLRKFGEGFVTRVLSENPRKIIDNETI